ncbi:transposase [Ralstonia pseudosolanacearum]|nr:transposase [Ralstonia pseudosolanacearum]
MDPGPIRCAARQASREEGIRLRALSATPAQAEHQPRIARRGIARNDRLGKHRWVVERTHAWLAGFGKLQIRFERSLDTHLAWLTLACAVICGRCVERFC